MVIRPSKLPKPGALIPQPKGTYIAELPKGPFDYLVGFIVRVRVQEVLKRDRWVRENHTIEIFALYKLEGGVSLSPKQRFVLALAPFDPKKADLAKRSVLKAGQSLSKPGAPEWRDNHYGQNRQLIDEIKEAIY